MQRLWAKIQFVVKGYRNFGQAGFENASKEWDDLEMEYDVSGKCFIVTGANSGIGKEAAMGIAKRGGEVHMLCRNEERGNKAKDEISEKANSNSVYLHIVDISEPSSITDFVNQWYEEDKAVHCLVNNAGVLLNEKQTNSQGYETTYATNLQGCYILTELMLPALVSGATKETPARVVTVSSGGMYTKKLELDNIETYPHQNFDGVDAYANTKRAQIYLSEQWAKKYSEKHPIHFYCMHPGWAATPGVEKSLPSFSERLADRLRSPEEGADTIVWLSVANSDPSPLRETGQFYFDRTIAP